MSRKPPTLVFLRQGDQYRLHQLRRAVSVTLGDWTPQAGTGLKVAVRQGDLLTEAQVQQLVAQGLDCIIRGGKHE